MSKKTRKLKKRFKLPLISAAVYLLLVLFVFPSFAVDNNPAVAYDFEAYREVPRFEIEPIDNDRIELLNERYDIEVDIQRAQNYLIRKNFAFQNRELSKIIVEESRKAGADFRIVIGIMGKESGFCNAPYKTYNCFGWLNGVQYGSYEQAFRSIVPGVARYAAGAYMSPASLISLGQRYGAVNYENWGQSVYRFGIGI